MYVEGENDVRTKLVGFFSRWKNRTGDPALWWEVAREWRLGRQETCSDVAARKTRAMRGTSCFLSGETSSIPGTGVPRSSTNSLDGSGRYPIGHSCLHGTAWRESTRTTDEKPAFASAGLTDQVALHRSYPPSSLIESARNLDSSRAVCPISRTSENHRPQFRSTPIRKPCQWGKQECLLETTKHNLCPETLRNMSPKAEDPFCRSK